MFIGISFWGISGVCFYILPTGALWNLEVHQGAWRKESTVKDHLKAQSHKVVKESRNQNWHVCPAHITRLQKKVVFFSALSHQFGKIGYGLVIGVARYHLRKLTWDHRSVWSFGSDDSRQWCFFKLRKPLGFLKKKSHHPNPSTTKKSWNQSSYHPKLVKSDPPLPHLSSSGSLPPLTSFGHITLHSQGT